MHVEISPLIPTITYDSSSNAIVEINEQATLNILITDQYGIPVKNTLVAFSIDTLGILLPETGTTDSNGYLTINAISENSGVYLISASLYGVTEQWTLVIYDPEGSYVTGGGWFNSPQGAYAPDSTLTGKATFGFVSKYKKGANIPTGETQFQFKYANLNFHSTSYDWMVVAGSKAQYKGTGTINGEGEYGFMLTATDGDLKDDKIDTFRLKIWDKTTDTLVYDNMLGSLDGADPTTAIGGGSIIIHK